MGSSGCLVHPASPARAIDAPISFMKPRRDTGSTHSWAAEGNSRSTAAWNSGVFASSSTKRQYFLPFTPLSLARTDSSVIGWLDAASLLPEQVQPVPQHDCAGSDVWPF